MDRKTALAPLEFIVSALGGCLLVLFVFSALGLAFGDDPPAGYVDPVCVTGEPQAVDDSLAGTRPPILQLSLDVTANYREIELCDASPTTRQRWLERLVMWPKLLFPIVTLVLLWRLVRRARRSGFFVPEIAVGVGRLGLFVLGWGVFVTALQAWAASELVATMAPEGTVNAAWPFLEQVLTPLLVGFGLLTVSRVLAQAVPMQRELDTTV
jgi:hypothetical protein